MRARNVSRKERNMLTLDNFRGVDFSSSPLNVSSNRAASMRNFILEDGRTKKRNGWKQIHRCFDNIDYDYSINGIFEYKDGSHHVIIHQVESSLRYWDASLNQTQIDYNNTAFLGSGFKSKCQAFYKDRKLYFVGGNIVAYGTWDNGETYTSSYLKSMDAYIPTTTISIDAEGGRVASLEPPNLLTKKRKNQLSGKNLTADDISNSGAEWHLDISPDLSERVELIIETLTNQGSRITIVLSNEDPTSGERGSKIYCETDLDDGKIYHPTVSNERTSVKKGYYCGHISEEVITLWINIPPQIEDRDNVTVIFTAKMENTDFEKKQNQILNCTIGTLFGAEGANDRLFLSGNPDYPNMVYFSGINDFTYWPDTNYLVAGSEASPVNGFQRLADNTLAIYKAGGDYEPTIYYAWGDLVTKTDDDTGAEITDEVFYIKSGAVGEGCVSARACAYFAGDNIMLSKNGVFGIVLTDNVSTNERYARERSRLINSKLCQADLSKASAIVYKGKYYLALNDEVGSCFVANARYKTSVDDDIDGSYNYEWWYWDNVPARTWAIIDDQLWFGTDDGRICVFDDEYADRTYITTSDGEIAFNGDHVTASSILASDIEKANSVTFNADVYALIHTADKLDGGRIVLDTYKTTADEKGEEIKLYDIFNLHEGMEVYVDTVGSSGLSVDTAYTVTDVDYGACSYKLTLNGADVVPASTGFKVYLRIPAETPLYIYDTDNTDLKFWLKATEDGDPLDLCAYNSTASSTSVSATFEYRSPVVAEWYTPVLDFGTNEQSKTLLKITVCAEATPGGKLSLGYDTRYANSHEIKGINTFSLNRISLQNFSFDGDSPTAILKRSMSAISISCSSTLSLITTRTALSIHFRQYTRSIKQTEE